MRGFKVKANAMRRHMIGLSEKAIDRLAAHGFPVREDYIRKARKGLLNALDKKFGVKVKQAVPEIIPNIQGAGGAGYLLTPKQGLKVDQRGIIKNYKNLVKDSYKNDLNTRKYIDDFAKQNNMTHKKAMRTLTARGIVQGRQISRKYDGNIHFDKKTLKDNFGSKRGNLDQVFHHEGLERLAAHTGKIDKRMVSKFGHNNTGILLKEQKLRDRAGIKSDDLTDFRKETGEIGLIKKYLPNKKVLKNSDYKKAAKRWQNDLNKGNM